MLYLVTGGSGSGKSEFAENTAVKLSNKNNSKLYYVATMQIYDKESEKRVEKHKKMRDGKGFETVECQTDIKSLAFENSVVIIECISNLLANEMFSETGSIKNGDVCTLAEKYIAEPIFKLAEKNAVVVVTNEVFSGGEDYDEFTLKYISALGNVNAKLAEKADCVTEVVCSVPVSIKGEEI